MTIVNHECYVSFEVANLLIKAGFDWRDYFVAHSIDEHFHWEIPLHIAQRWLRVVKECAVIVETHNVQAACVSAYVYYIYPTDATHPCKHINGFAEDQCFNTYEEAQEAGIKKALEIILEKGE